MTFHDYMVKIKTCHLNWTFKTMSKLLECILSKDIYLLKSFGKESNNSPTKHFLIFIIMILKNSLILFLVQHFATRSNVR